MTLAVGAVSSDRGTSFELNGRFAVGMAVAMLAVNVIGFGPTLYLRAAFDVPKIPFYLYAHGAVGTAWFVLVIAQARLIGTRQVRKHRKLGWLGVGLAALLLMLGVYTSTHMVSRNAALGAVSEADIRLYGVVTSADLAGFIIIPTLIALAILFRRRIDVHMRLMLLATLEMLGPATTRIASWFGEIPNPVIPIVLLGFVAAMGIHDVRARGRVHPATALGTLFLLAVILGVRLSGVGPAIVAHRLAHP